MKKEYYLLTSSVKKIGAYFRSVSTSFKETSEVQTIQVADGDVSHLYREAFEGREFSGIPLHMVLPRWFVAPTVNTSTFKISYELKVHVIFIDDSIVISETIPLTVFR